jgi:hypothetical protein
MRRKVEIPDANAGSLDSKPKALVSNGIVRRWMLDRGHFWPSLPGGAEGYQDARWQASALKVLPFRPPQLPFGGSVIVPHANLKVGANNSNTTSEIFAPTESAIEEIVSALICLSFFTGGQLTR